MYPILARYGSFFLYTYAIVAGVGCLLALGLTAARARRLKLNGWLDGVLWATVVALFAGRLAFVWLNAPYFAEHPAEVWRIWLGGVNHHAALVSGLLAYWLWCRATGRSFGVFAGLIAPGLAVVVSALWAACWFEGCAYGREGLPGLLRADLPDSFGVMAVRYQVQLMGALLSAGVAGIALASSQRLPPTAVFWLTLFLLSLIALALEPLRGDSALVWGGLPAGAYMDAALAIVGGLGLFLTMRNSPRYAPPSDN